jgi:4-amino-4-deoxy-L-arabinose transferase-like glycosyltransferase
MVAKIGDGPGARLPWWRRVSREQWLMAGIVLLAIALRLYRFTSVPGGINQDEADAGYEAYSLLHTGADKWGFHLPVYFVSWGTGQNVLQSYLSIPFVALFGLNAFSVRIVPALLGILTVPLMYDTARKLYNPTVGVLAALFVAVAPWHIMLSRWGLESDLLPFFMLLAVCIWIYAFEDARFRWLLPFVLVPFAFALYAYAISAVPIGLMIVGFALVYRQEIGREWARCLAGLASFVVLAGPLLAFMLLNTVLRNDMAILAVMQPAFLRSHEAWLTHLPITVPLLPVTRISQVSTGGPLLTLQQNLPFLTHGFADGLPWNTLPGFLPLGFLFIPFALPGLFFTLRGREKRHKLLAIWFFAALSVLFIAPLNGNRGNALFLPLLVLSAVTIWQISQWVRNKVAQRLILVAVALAALVYGGLFAVAYFHQQNQNVYNTFNIGFNTALSAALAHQQHGELIVISSRINLNYVYTIFYLHANPTDFQKHVVYHIVKGVYIVQHYDTFVFDPRDPLLKHATTYLMVLKTGDRKCAHATVLMHQGQWTVVQCGTPKPIAHH